MAGILQRQQWNPVDAAQLLRELSAELRDADGAARNGLFLELHRLHDTLFRHTLENHPDAPLELAARAFDRQESMPAPQVLQELLRLGTPWVTMEMRNRYKHMNAVRNNIAHEAVLERVVVSRRNSRAMASLATLVADALDPEGQGSVGEPARRDTQSRGTVARLPWLLAGLALGSLLWWLWQASNPVFGAALVVVLGCIAGAFWLDRESSNN